MKFIEKIKKDNIINLIKNNSPKSKLYLVGGCVRDYILGKDNFDKDIIADVENPKEFSQNLAQKLNATFIELDSENKIYRLVLKDKINFIDIAAIIGKNIEDDLKRRDLTINSIAINLENFKILDINNGLNDLKNGIIKHISEKNIQDDYLRILRAFRFQSTLGFEIDENLLELVKKHYRNISKCSVERINYELIKLFGGKYCHKTLLNMDKCGLIEYFFPFIVEVKKVPENSHHHLPLFLHQIETVKQIQNIFENTPEIQSHLKRDDFGGASRLSHLKFAGFLHDIGKPKTWTIEEDTNRHRFIKHDDVGAKIAIEFLKKNKYSKKQINYVSQMIKNHIYPSHVVSAPILNDKIYMRFIRKMQDNAIDIIVLAMADRLSARGEAITDEIVNENISKLNNLMSFYLSVKDELAPLEKLIDGNEIMKILQIPPSKKLGEIISKLKEAQISGEINTKEEAITYIKSLR